ncbi:SLATT domain-containing protein [Sphingomonas sp. RT2P30]|uniref:SLATT domain-containing protein n=1 Tax=Parasphingomonas halimpatiens TaxID=3096162 RepID=UPI002FC75309
MSDTQKISRIWLTYKARINSERRFRRYALLSHLGLSWYAFLSIVFSIYQGSVATKIGESSASQTSLIISVLTFGLSLVIYGFKFDDVANQHRDCYLRMQAIYKSQCDAQTKLNQYHDLLIHYPNHSTSDYDNLLFDAWKRGDAISNEDGKITLGTYVVVVGSMRLLLNFLLSVILFLFPLAIWLWFNWH